jgi:hypothetical protein
MPPELREVSNPVEIVSEEQWAKEQEEIAKNPEEFHRHNLTKKMQKELIDKYDHDNWYSWATDNWGTKWDCYDVGEWQIMHDEPTTAATVHYSTAWSPATAALVVISKLYPELVFHHEFADEGGYFVGFEDFQNGEIINEQDFKWESKEGIRIRNNVGYGPD